MQAILPHLKFNGRIFNATQPRSAQCLLLWRLRGAVTSSPLHILLVVAVLSFMFLSVNT